MSKAPSLDASWSRAGELHLEPRLTRLGARHGVTTRALGNMKDAERRSAALKAAGLSGDPFLLNQVHGTAVWETTASSPELRPTGDGWVCAQPGAACAVYVADCLPIFVWERTGAAVGVFHAGWRGVAAGMPRAAVRAFRRFGFGPERLAAAIGPHVGGCCYKVGPDVAAKFRAEVQREGRLDLGAEARLQLQESGIAAEEISVSGACTSCLRDEFFSYRRDKQDQRMLAFVSLSERPSGH